MAHISKYQANKETPKTLTDLIRKASPVLWNTSHKYKNSMLTNVMDADDILGRPYLADITTDAIDFYTRTVAADLRPGSVNRKLTALHTLLKYAVDREWLVKMPKFTWMKDQAERIRWLSQEEEKQLLELLPKVDKNHGEEIAALCEILLHTGCRRDEIRKLERSQIDGDYLRLWKTKTKRPRSVPLTDRAKELVDKYVPFKVTAMQVHRAWAKVRKEMGLADDRDFVLHTLRHTTATRLLDTTNNIVVVQKMLGHSKIATTLRYAHLADDGLLDSIRLTAKKYGTSPTTA